MTEDACIIGRFQPLHLGHEDVIAYARETYDEVTLLMTEGRDVPSDRNPLSIEEREQLLDDVYGAARDVEVDVLLDDNEAIHHGAETVTEALAGYHDDPTEVACVTENPETIDALGDTYTIDTPPQNEYREKPYRGGHVRDQAAHEEQWKPYVSGPVAARLEEYGFEERMEELWDDRERT